MRRWRAPDGRTYVESPDLGDVRYYRLDKRGAVDRAYRDETGGLEGELHQLRFAMMGRDLVRRHSVKTARGTEDRSGVEVANLELLAPDESPTEHEAAEAIATYKHGAEEVERHKQAAIDRVVESAAPSIRDVVRRLAERVIRHDDEHCRTLMSALGALAKLRRGGGSPHLTEATEAVLLAARLVTHDPSARKAVLPRLKPSPALELARSLQGLEQTLRKRAEAHDNLAATGVGSDAAAAAGNAAQVLAVAIAQLLRDVEID